MSELERGKRRLTAWRLALAGWLAGWFVNTLENARLFASATEYPITAHPLFPAPMREPWVAQALLILPLVGFAGFATREARALRWLSLGLMLGALGLLGHLCSYNDASYTTSFWGALWLAWWAGRINGEDPDSERHAIAIGQGIVGLCFLGGTVGKLTPEYWSGEAFYQIYVVQKPYFPFAWMREHWTEATARAWSAGFARGVIVTEGLLATLIWWPVRAAFVAATVAFLGMILLARLQLASVLAPLWGLMAASAWLGNRGWRWFRFRP